MSDYSGDLFWFSSGNGSNDGRGSEGAVDVGGAGGVVVKWFWKLVGDLSMLERGLLLR